MRRNFQMFWATGNRSAFESLQTWGEWEWRISLGQQPVDSVGWFESKRLSCLISFFISCLFSSFFPYSFLTPYSSQSVSSNRLVFSFIQVFIYCRMFYVEKDKFSLYYKKCVSQHHNCDQIHGSTRYRHDTLSNKVSPAETSKIARRNGL
jgi:hypothetical protein